MRLRALLREAWATAWAAKVSSILTVVVVMAMCLAALVTVGRSAAAAFDVADRMEQEGARRLSVVDTRDGGFVNARTLAVVRHVSSVESADALGAPFDAVNGLIGPGEHGCRCGRCLVRWTMWGRSCGAGRRGRVRRRCRRPSCGRGGWPNRSVT